MFYDVLNDLRCFSNVSLVVGPVNAGGLSDVSWDCDQILTDNY